MSVCPSPIEKESEEYQLLVKEVGKVHGESIWRANGNSTPSKEKIPMWVSRYNTQNGATEELAKAKQYEKIINNIRTPGVRYDREKKAYWDIKNERWVSHRVSDRVRQYSKHVGTDYRGEDDPFYALKGTVIHSYLEEIGTAIKEKRSFSYKEINEEVLKLKNFSEFDGKNDKFFTLSDGQYKSLVVGMRDLMSSVENIQKEIDPEGKVEFFFEVPVLDQVEDLAGTVDMLAVFSDGTAALYDFKSYSLAGRQAPGATVQNKWNVQVSNYKNILKTSYGIKNFRRSRALPLKARYTTKQKGKAEERVEEGFRELTMQNNRNAENLDFLDPIPVKELTGDKNLDTLIQRLLDEKAQTEKLYQKASKKDKGRFIKKLTRLNKSLKNIQLTRDIEGTINDLAYMHKEYRKRLYKTPSEKGYIENNELLDVFNEMQIFANVSDNYKDQLGHLPEEKKATMKARLSNAESATNTLANDILEVFKNRLADGITEPGQHMGDLSRNVLGLQDFNIPVFQELLKVISVANEKTRQDTKKEYEKVGKISKDFEAWGENNGYGGYKKFDLIYDAKKGKLHSQFVPEFMKKRHEIRKKADKGIGLTKEEKTWLKDHFKFDREAYEERRKIQIETIDYQLERGDISKSKADLYKENFYKFNSVDANPENFYSTMYLVPKEKGNEQYYSKEWKFIQQHAPVKAYYDMWLDYNKEWTNEFGYETFGKYFIPNVKAGMFDQIVQKGLAGAPNMFEAFKRQHQIFQQDEIAGAQDGEGNQLASVPLPFTDPLLNNLTPKEENQIREQVRADVSVTHEEGTKEFQNEVDRRIRLRQQELGTRSQSKDLTKSLMAMIYSVNNYRHMTEIEGEILMMKALMHNKQIESHVLNERDNKLVDAFTGELKKRIGMDSEYVSIFDDFVEMYVYGREFRKDKEILGGYSRNKIVKTAMNFLSIRALGLNLKIQISDAIQAKSSLYFKAKEGIMFDKTGIKAAFDLYGKRDPKFKQLVDFFEPAARDLREEDIREAGANFASRQLTQRSLFIGYEWTDENVSNLILAGMAKKWIVDSDGKIKNPDLHEDDIIDKDAPTVFDSIEVKEDGTIFIEGLTIEEFTRFRLNVQKQSNLIRGSVNEYQKGVYSRSLLLQAVGQFKSWMPGMATDRFQKLKYDNMFETWEVGRFNVGFSELLGNGFMGSLKSFIQIGTEAVSMGLYKKEANMNSVKRHIKKFLEVNPSFKDKIDPEDPSTYKVYYKIHQGKLRGLAAELRIYLGLILLVQLFTNLGWDEIDEEDNTTIFSWEAQNIVRRALLEASFWWNPKSVESIVVNPIALMGLATELTKIVGNTVIETTEFARGIDNKRDKTFLGYYMLKNVPVVNKILDFSNFFDKYHPPKTVLERMFSGDPEE